MTDAAKTTKTFHCRRWPQCGCPEGAVAADCPGQTRPVLGRLAFDLNPGTAEALRGLVARLSSHRVADTGTTDPVDWALPDWAEEDGRGEWWKDFATDELREVWPTFNDAQKRAVARCLQDIAEQD